MGDHQGQARPQGYIVRIETKQGCVYRPKTIAQQLAPGASGDAAIIDAKTTRRLVAGMTPANAGQRRRYRFPVAPHMVVQTVSSSSSGSSSSTQSSGFPQGKSRAKLGDDSIELGIDLARSDMRLPGEHRTQAALPPPLFASEAEQDAELYRRGILYHDDNDADSLDGIQHTQPAYTVRLVDAKKRRGKKTAAAAAAVATAAAKVKVDASTETVQPTAASPDEDAAEEEEEEIQLIKELPVPEGLRLFTLGNLWEEESPGVGGDGDAADRLLGHEDINLHDIENIEYILIDDDDLHSMAASWVELDSVAESDDWT